MNKTFSTTSLRGVEGVSFSKLTLDEINKLSQEGQVYVPLDLCKGDVITFDHIAQTVFQNPFKEHVLLYASTLRIRNGEVSQMDFPISALRRAPVDEEMDKLRENNELGVLLLNMFSDYHRAKHIYNNKINLVVDEVVELHKYTYSRTERRKLTDPKDWGRQICFKWRFATEAELKPLQ